MIKIKNNIHDLQRYFINNLTEIKKHIKEIGMDDFYIEICSLPYNEYSIFANFIFDHYMDDDLFSDLMNSYMLPDVFFYSESEIMSESTYSDGKRIPLGSLYSEKEEESMNLYAYHPNDVSKKLVHIEDWLVNHHNQDGCCRICNEPIYVKGDKSQKQTHFCHYPKSLCPSVLPNHEPYKFFQNFPRDPFLAIDAKRWLKDNMINVYEKIKSQFPSLKFTWSDLIKTIEEANKLNIWSLEDMPHDYIPYVLLTCIDKFSVNNYRKQECFFVLEPTPSNNTYYTGYWNQTGLSKKYVWEIQLPLKIVVQHEVNLSTPIAWYIGKINRILE